MTKLARYGNVMSPDISLRKATIDDLEILYEWRNDLQTREASRMTDRVSWEKHESWLRASLKDPNRKLYIAEENSVPVGTLRADLSDGIHELSWTVSPKVRGRGIGKRMVFLLAQKIKGPLKAEIRKGNAASIQIAEKSGMRFHQEKNGMMYYTRNSVDKGE